MSQIKADFIKLCGKIDYTQKETDSKKGYQVQVTITPVGSNSQDKRATSASEDGTYCFELPPNDYMVRPTILYKNKKFNVVPKERKVKIFDEPALSVDFSREKLSVSGRVVIDKNIDASILKDTKIVLKNQNGAVQVTKTWSETKNGVFEFGDLFDEGYVIQVQNDKLCFDKQEISTSEYSGNVTFNQKGMWISYKSEIDLSATLTSSTGVEDKISILKGNNKFCSKFTGKIIGKVGSDYILKNDMNRFKFDPATASKLSFQVEKIKADAYLKVDIAQLKKIYPKNISDEALLSKFDVQIKDTSSSDSYKSNAKIIDNMLIYSFYTKPNRKVIVTPTIVDSNLSQRLVILQNSKTLSIGNVYNSQVQSGPFEITIGKNLSVSVDKEIQGGVKLHIKKRVNKDSYYQEDKVVILKSKTQNLGTFNGNYDYTVELSKDGFEFEVTRKELANGDIQFNVSTLEISRLEIRVQNANGQAASGVTVYITSAERGKAIKIVDQTDKNGLISKQIHKGNYYLKAVLKEYKFDPPQKTFMIEEGETYKLNIVATRTQFSVHGVGKYSKYNP